jgi:hypothetical protein
MPIAGFKLKLYVKDVGVAAPKRFILRRHPPKSRCFSIRFIEVIKSFQIKQEEVCRICRFNVNCDSRVALKGLTGIPHFLSIFLPVKDGYRPSFSTAAPGPRFN